MKKLKFTVIMLALMSLLVAKKMVDNSKAQNEVDTTQKTILQIAE